MTRPFRAWGLPPWSNDKDITGETVRLCLQRDIGPFVHNTGSVDRWVEVIGPFRDSGRRHTGVIRGVSVEHDT